MSEISNINLETYIKELKQVYYLISSMQKSTNLKKILNNILQESINITKATSGSIMFRHMQSDRLYFYVSQGIHQSIIDSTDMHIGDGIAGTVIAEGIPKIINNIKLDPKYITINSNVQSEMAVPIIVKNKIFGVIVLDHSNTDYFTEKHLELVQMICSHTGFIISHHIESLLAEKNNRLFKNLINIHTTTSTEDIFKILTTELKAQGTCIIDTQCNILFQEGIMQTKLPTHPNSLTEICSIILSEENEQKIPYTRIIVPLIQQDLTFIADKIYYFAENTLTDIKFTDKILEFLSIKVPKPLQDISISQWIENVISLDASGSIYDTAIETVEKELIEKALKKYKDNKFKTAQFLGINRNTLRNKMELYNL